MNRKRVKIMRLRRERQKTDMIDDDTLGKSRRGWLALLSAV
jgi:hypothetical protein